MMEDEIVNKVAGSGLVQLDLEAYLPEKKVLGFDLASVLGEGMVLREKEFRQFISGNDWSPYNNTIAAIQCSADVIIPNWAYMLLVVALTEAGAESRFGTVSDVTEGLLVENLRQKGSGEYAGKKVLVKGCGSFDLSPRAFVEVTNFLLPAVDSPMFGEACSSVPIRKKRNS